MTLLARVGVVCDLHWAAQPLGWAHWHNPYDFAGLEARAQAAAAWFASQRVEAVLVLGDVSDAGDAEDASRPLAWLAGAGCPVLMVAGNHDLARSAAAGAGPWLESVGSLRVLGVGVESGDGGLTTRGVLPDALGGDALALVASHYPLVSQAERLASEGFSHPGDLLNRPALERALGGPAIVVHGHLHARLSVCRGELLQLGFAALVEHPAEAAVVEVAQDADGIEVRRLVRSLGALPHVRTPVLDDAGVWRLAGGAWRVEQAAT